MAEQVTAGGGTLVDQDEEEITVRAQVVRRGTVSPNNTQWGPHQHYVVRVLSVNGRQPAPRDRLSEFRIAFGPSDGPSILEDQTARIQARETARLFIEEVTGKPLPTRGPPAKFGPRTLGRLTKAQLVALGHKINVPFPRGGWASKTKGEIINHLAEHLKTR